MRLFGQKHFIAYCLLYFVAYNEYIAASKLPTNLPASNGNSDRLTLWMSRGWEITRRVNDGSSNSRSGFVCSVLHLGVCRLVWRVAMNAPIIMQRMTREQACLLLESLYKWADQEIHADAYEDPLVSVCMSDLHHLVDCFSTVLEVSDRYESESRKYSKALNFFNGDKRRAMEA